MSRAGKVGLVSDYASLLDAIGQVHRSCQAGAITAVNQALIARNWLIGAYIVEYEQRGSDRAEYGERLISKLSRDLRREAGSGCSATNLKQFRQFYLAYSFAAKGQTLSDLFAGRLWAKPKRSDASDQSVVPPATLLLHSGDIPPSKPGSVPAIWQKLSAKLPRREFGVEPVTLFARLTWSHILELSRIDAPHKRAFYEIEALRNNWSVRELKRQINSMLFERVGLSKDKQGVLELAKQGQLITQPSELFKDPYVLEFTGLAERPHYVEGDLETALLNHLQRFLLELGQGFCFEARQKRITIDGEHDYIDLVFYHRLLRCHVLIDLKIRKFRPADAGQMNFYLNFYRKQVMAASDSPPVGLILCTDRDRVHVEYATAGLDNQVFVSRYLVTLPSVEQLERFLEEERDKLIGELPRTIGHRKPGELRRSRGRRERRKQ